MILLSNFFLSQALIGVAICIDILSFQFKERITILAFLAASTILVSIHFMLLGHWTAAILALLAVARYSISIFTTSSKAMWLFLAIISGITVGTFDGLLSLLGCAAAFCTTLAAFRRTDKDLRKMMMLGTSVWIVHNYLAGSPGAVLMECIFIVSNFVGYFRYYIRPEYKYLTNKK